jgi:hypothetical protein
VVAVDSAPTGSKKSSTVSVKLEIVDENDNPPLFSQYEYSAIIVDNIPFYPDPSPIVQVSALDPDQVRTSFRSGADFSYIYFRGKFHGKFRGKFSPKKCWEKL